MPHFAAKGHKCCKCPQFIAVNFLDILQWTTSLFKSLIFEAHIQNAKLILFQSSSGDFNYEEDAFCPVWVLRHKINQPVEKGINQE